MNLAELVGELERRGVGLAMRVASHELVLQAARDGVFVNERVDLTAADWDVAMQAALRTLMDRFPPLG